MAYIPRSDFDLAVGRGLVAGITGVHVDGLNLDVDGDEDVWDGPTAEWVAPTAARIHNIVSTSASDAAAGTGARTVHIVGLDSAYEEVEEIVTMNGITNVPTTIAYTRINHLEVETAGSGAANAGVITATAVTDATVTATIATGVSQERAAIYTVPAGYKMYITSFSGGLLKPGGVSITMYVAIATRAANVTGAPWYESDQLSLSSDASSGAREAFAPYREIAGVTDVKLVTRQVSAANNIVHATFQAYLVAD